MVQQPIRNQLPICYINTKKLTQPTRLIPNPTSSILAAPPVEAGTVIPDVEVGVAVDFVAVDFEAASEAATCAGDKVFAGFPYGLDTTFDAVSSSGRGTSGTSKPPVGFGAWKPPVISGASKPGVASGSGRSAGLYGLGAAGAGAMGSMIWGFGGLGMRGGGMNAADDVAMKRVYSMVYGNIMTDLEKLEF